MRKKIALCTCFLLTFVSFIQAEILSDALLNGVKEKHFLQNIFQNKDSVSLGLFPDTELSKAAVGSWDSKDEPVYTTEKLFYLPKAVLVENSANPSSCDTSVDSVSKVLRSISKMKGMEYYSNGDKKWETLYHESHFIASPNDKTPIPDDVDGSADGKEFYCLQEDNSFGTCIYKLKYSQRADEISVCFVNAESLKYGPITAVKPGNLRMNIVLVEQDSYYLVYMLVQAKYPSLSFLESRLNRSFNARVDAIYKWFTMSF